MSKFNFEEEVRKSTHSVESRFISESEAGVGHRSITFCVPDLRYPEKHFFRVYKNPSGGIWFISDFATLDAAMGEFFSNAMGEFFSKW